MRVSKAIRNFLALESAAGILLAGTAAAALLIANTPLESLYDDLLGVIGEVRIGAFSLSKPLLLWINDGLMAIFFLLIGLEVKRELLVGELADRAKASLPFMGALGGLVVPAAIYVALNPRDPEALAGWAIPAATDIAFALGVLSLLGRRVPESLKIFLLSLAILDDLAAILIIAIFYTSDLSLLALGLGLVLIAIQVVLNRRGVSGVGPYLVVGAILWVVVLKSGVHATLAGVVTAFTIPNSNRESPRDSPYGKLEHSLHPWVAYGILPLFAFANAGLILRGQSLTTLLQPVPLGIVLGLVLGKPAGIFGICWLAIRAGLAKLPQGASMSQLFGTAVLCGIGFTMSLFISSLAFEHGATQYFLLSRLGILVASVVSAVLGLILLKRAGRNVR